MSLPDQTPKLPKLPFIIGDLILLGIAGYLVATHPAPLDSTTLIAVVVCVALGTVLGAIPFLTDYARRQDEALDERQRGLDALSRTLTNAAEQISIAANGLHQIVEIAHKSLKQAEQLPHKLQDKISEFNAQLENARDDDREELEKELAELRATESERLATLADKIQQSVAELAKLDAAARQHLTSHAEALQRAETAPSRGHTDVAGAISEALAAFTRERSDAESKTLAAIEAKFAERAAAVIAAIETAAAKAATGIAPATPALAPTPTPPAEISPPAPAAETVSPPKRSRKPRRDESVSTEESPAPSSETPAPQPPAGEPAPSAPPAAAEPISTPTEEPRPIPADTIPAIEPVAPRSDHPFAPESVTVPVAPAETPAVETPSLEPSPESSAPPADRPPRKRAPRKPEPDPTPSLDLPLDDIPTTPPASDDDVPMTAGDAVESVLSSDGATRLIATAYIGIGNRLFIRGDGPGLSWDKGVPLQFVSIGKWRWETSDASSPIRFKLYKNDETECASLGELTVDPGHQQEVTARF